MTYCILPLVQRRASVTYDESVASCLDTVVDELHVPRHVNTQHLSAGRVVLMQTTR